MTSNGPTTITTTTTSSLPIPIPTDISAQIQIHRGAIDQTMITTQPPASVMNKVRQMLLALGVTVQTESTFRLRCVRPNRKTSDSQVEVEEEDAEKDEGSDRTDEDMKEENEEETEEGPKTPTQTHPQLPPASPPSPSKPPCSLYGPTPSDDPAGEVRFSIELTKLAGLSDTYSLDIRRLKGHLRSYKYIYDTLRDRSELNR